MGDPRELEGSPCVWRVQMWFGEIPVGSQVCWRGPREFEGIPASLKESQGVWKNPREFEGIPGSLKAYQGVWRDPREFGGNPGSLKGSQGVWRDSREFEGTPGSLKESQGVWRNPREFEGIPGSMKESQRVWRDPREFEGTPGSWRNFSSGSRMDPSELEGFQGFRGIPRGMQVSKKCFGGLPIGFKGSQVVLKIFPLPTPNPTAVLHINF